MHIKIYYTDKNYIMVHFAPDEHTSMEKIMEHYVHEPERG